MRLAPEGVREWGSTIIVTAVALPLVWWLSPVPWINWLVTVVIGVLAMFVIQFFRDPHRQPPPSVTAEDCVSPADGVITAVEHVDLHEAVDAPAVVIRIFLNVFNVHVNRVPCDATVRDAIYREGQYLDARKPESAQVNESNLVRMTRTDGMHFGVRQVSGAIARRIKCTLSGGEALQRAQRMGMIKFGSTTELILPRSAQPQVHVTIGEPVRGGVTILATVPLGHEGSDQASA